MAGTQVQGVPQGLVEEEIPQQNTQSVQGVPEGLTEEALPAPNNPALETAKANVAKYPHQEAQEENHWVGKLVPQGATGFMKSITDSAPIRMSEELGQKGAQALGEVGANVGEAAVTGADILSHPIRSFEKATGTDFSNPMRSQFQPQPVTQTPEQIAEEEHPLAMGISRGAGRAVGEFAGGFADPRMAILAIASGGAGDVAPVLSKIASGGFGLQMGAHAIGVAADLAHNWGKYTPEQRAQMITDAGLSGYFGAKALGHTGVPEVVRDKLKTTAAPTVRMLGHTVEGMSTPAVAGGAAGAFLGPKIGLPHGASEVAGGTVASGIAQSMGKSPFEPIVRVPKMTNFKPEAPIDKAQWSDSIHTPQAAPEPTAQASSPATAEQIRQNLVPAKQAAGEYTEPKEQAPVPQEDKGLKVLQDAYDKANSAYQKAFDAREAYRASMDQGVQPPAAVQKAFEKAEKALEEAQFHYETALNGKEAPEQAQDIREKLVPAKEAAGAYQPETEKVPENVKKSGEVAPERIAPVRMNKGFDTEPIPTIRGGQHELPHGGTMGKPLQLPGQVGDSSAFDNVEDIRSRMVPAKEAAGAYDAPIEAPVSKTVNKIGDLTREGLGGQELERNKPLREQIPAKPEGEILPPEKEQTQSQKAWETALRDMGQDETGEEKTIEGEPKLSSRPDKAELQKAGAGPETMEKLLNLTQVELRQLAISAGEDMGQEAIGSGKNPKASGKTPRQEVFQRLLNNHTPEELAQMVDDGKHLPPVSGGSQGAAVAPFTKEAADLDTDLFRRAKEALGPDASLSDVAKTAQAMKDELKNVNNNASGESAASQEAINRQASEKNQGIKRYRVDSRTGNAVPLIGPDAVDATAGKFDHIVQVGPNGEETILDSGASARPLTRPVGSERRATPRTAPLGAKELEEAIKQRKTVATPFDVTEGASKTIESDKNMPKPPQTDLTKLVEAANKKEGREPVDWSKPQELGKDTSRIADAYDQAKHEPDNPEVKKSYNSLVDDVKKQWNYIQKKMGISIEPQEEDPYSSFEEMKQDVEKNHRLKVFTGGNSLPEDHPMAKVDPKTGETYNTMFRAVHDIFGHLSGDNDFSQLGEEGAWKTHRQTLSPEAVPAMTNETRSQTSSFFKNSNTFPEQKATIPPDYAMSDASDAKKVFDHIKSGKNYALLTAENPGNERLSDEDNLARNQEFLKELRDKGYKPVPVEGHVKDVPGQHEHSFFIPDISPKDIKALGEKYGQASVMTSKGLYDLKNDTTIPIDDSKIVTGKDAENQDYFSKIGGEAFSIPVDFSGETKSTPKASMQTSRMSDAELKSAGFTPEQIENGEHLPSVAGGKTTKAEAEALAKEHLKEGEQFKTENSRDKFIKNIMSAPSVQEFADIAKAGESGRKWYQRSQAAFDSLVKAAPRYFQEGDRQKFTDFVAALSPQQSVKMNLQEALHAWSKYVDMGRPEGKPLETMLNQELALPKAKVGNAVRALKGEELWPDISKNENFKVPSFAKNLKGFMDAVTNDGWQAAFADASTVIGKSHSYHPLSVLTRAAAKELGWEPAEAQAAIWAFTKTLTEHGEKSPERVRDYSEDFADLMAHDPHVRQQLSDLGIDLGELDEHLRQIERKPEVSAGERPTTENSIGKLAKRLEKQRGKLPQTKDSGPFDRVKTDERESFFKPRETEDTSFDFGANEPIIKKARMKR